MKLLSRYFQVYEPLFLNQLMFIILQTMWSLKRFESCRRAFKGWDGGRTRSPPLTLILSRRETFTSPIYDVVLQLNCYARRMYIGALTASR